MENPLKLGTDGPSNVPIVPLSKEAHQRRGIDSEVRHILHLKDHQTQTCHVKLKCCGVKTPFEGSCVFSLIFFFHNFLILLFLLLLLLTCYKHRVFIAATRKGGDWHSPKTQFSSCASQERGVVCMAAPRKRTGIAAGALQVNETNNFQHMLFKKNCSSSISCAMWGSVACKHKARQGLH